MRILLVNKYFFIKGGAENSIFYTGKLLRAKGHEVAFFSMQHPQNFESPYSKYFVKNVDYDKPGNALQVADAAFKLLYSFEAKSKIDKLLRDFKPDLVHLNNIYHQLSPSILHAIRKHDVPAVMSLRDYKIVCASYGMVADGKICEACKGGKYYQCSLKKCVKNSLIKSLLNTFEMYLHHKILHIYEQIDTFISPSHFLKAKVHEMGYKGSIEVIPNFVVLDDFSPQYSAQERSICYFGRVSKEKGLVTLVDAVKGMNIKLKIIGEGPIKKELEDKIKLEGIENVEFLGHKGSEELKEEISRCMFTVTPSEWYENNPRSVIESFALGKPAVGARIGGIPELVRDNDTGFTFESRNAEDLRLKISQLIDNPSEIERMGRNARHLIEGELNPETHYKKLIKIYRNAIDKQKEVFRRKENLKYRIFWFLGTVGCALIYFSGIYWLHKAWRLKRKHFILMVLTYHSIRDDHKMPDITVSVDSFDRQLGFLKTHFQTVSLDDLLQFKEGIKELNSDTLSITLDEGYQDNYLNAYPIFRKYNVPATIFLVKNGINKEDEYLSVEQIGEMSKHSISFGSHTLSHPILSEIDQKDAHHEIARSKEELEKILKKEIKYFAYPRGKNIHINDGNVASVKEAGYKASFTTENGLIENDCDNYRLKRLGIRECPLFVFKVRTSGMFESGILFFLRKLFGVI